MLMDLKPGVNGESRREQFMFRAFDRICAMASPENATSRGVMRYHRSLSGTNQGGGSVLKQGRARIATGTVLETG